MQTRRVEGYYKKLLSTDMDVGNNREDMASASTNDFASSTTHENDEKWKKQIEKVIRCIIGLGLLTLISLNNISSCM